MMLCDRGAEDLRIRAAVVALAPGHDGVTFKWKDYRAKGCERHKVMTLAVDEFIRRFLIHVLPRGFHRIRHYGFLARASCAANLVRVRRLLEPPVLQTRADDAQPHDPAEHPCPCCGGRMTIIETFRRGCAPRTHPTGPIRLDTS
jgi:hypothetical protein